MIDFHAFSSPFLDGRRVRICACAGERRRNRECCDVQLVRRIDQYHSSSGSVIFTPENRHKLRIHRPSHRCCLFHFCRKVIVDHLKSVFICEISSMNLSVSNLFLTLPLLVSQQNGGTQNDSATFEYLSKYEGLTRPLQVKFLLTLL